MTEIETVRKVIEAELKAKQIRKLGMFSSYAVQLVTSEVFMQ